MSDSRSLLSVQPPLNLTLASTEYFEIDSEQVGARFGVWVTRPVGYDPDGSERYPVIYATDGNWLAGLTAPLLEQAAFDLIEDFKPYVQVTVGYVPEDLEQWLTLRNRDLIPPDEPVAESMLSAVAADAEVAGWSEDEHKAYLDLLGNAHADRFLAFLEEELRQEVEARYRVEPDSAALFGYSYGGIFTMYALLKGSTMFARYGAGSPGILTPDSQIFRMLEEASSAGHSFDGAQLHITVNERELIGKAWVFRDLGMQAIRLIDALYRGGQEDLDVTSRILPADTHAIGTTQAFISFLQTFYAGS